MKRLYIVDVIIKTPAKITVWAESENDAFGQVIDGAWLTCVPEASQEHKAKITHVGAITLKEDV